MTVQQFYEENPDRWIQNALVEGHRRCLIAAMHDCYPDYEARRSGAGRLEHELHLIGYASILMFNDDSTTTFKKMMRIVRRARI